MIETRDSFIQAIKKLGFKEVSQFGDYKLNNYKVSIQLYSRYTDITFSHDKSKMYISFSYFNDAYKEILSKVYNN